MYYKDFTGQKFGRLTAIKRLPRYRNNVTYYVCKCDCGNEIIVWGAALSRGNTKSCGCWQKENVTKRIVAQNTTHGKTHTRLYQVWRGMRTRCFNPNFRYYKNYGGRGIIMCEEWHHNFQAFYTWAMQNGYDENAKRGKCTIDRIDNNGNYEPNNCRITTQMQQCNNKRDNHLLAYNGETKTIAEWSRLLGWKSSTIAYRLKAGWNIERALTEKPKS